MKDRDFRIRTGDNTNVKRISSTRDLRELSDTNDGEPILNTTSETHSRSSSASTEIFAFDVYEREGFDQIMRTVAGATSEEQEAFAQSLCNTLEIFESMTLGRYVYIYIHTKTIVCLFVSVDFILLPRVNVNINTKTPLFPSEKNTNTVFFFRILMNKSNTTTTTTTIIMTINQ